MAKAWKRRGFKASAYDIKLSTDTMDIVTKIWLLQFVAPMSPTVPIFEGGFSTCCHSSADCEPMACAWLSVWIFVCLTDVHAAGPFVT